MVSAANPPSESTADSLDVNRFRFFFLAAAIWNFAGGAMGLVFLEPLSKLAWPRTALLGDPISVQFAMMVFGLVAVLGIGYLLVAFDPGRNRGLVLTAAIGKPVVLALGTYFSLGAGTPWLLIPAGGVVVFTLGFWWFLFSTRDLGWY